MELNLVPLIEAAKGITWQGALVILACLAAACYMARLRLLHGDKERDFWRNATPDQIQARAATTATLPKPSAAPPSPVVPLGMLIFFLGCTLVAESSPSILEARRILHRPPAQVELARVGKIEPGKPMPLGPVHRDCDSTWCKSPSFCSKGECVNTARKPPVHRMAAKDAGMSPSSVALRAPWQDVDPEAFVQPQSDEQWLAGVMQ